MLLVILICLGKNLKNKDLKQQIKTIYFQKITGGNKFFPFQSQAAMFLLINDKMEIENKSLYFHNLPG